MNNLSRGAESTADGKDNLSCPADSPLSRKKAKFPYKNLKTKNREKGYHERNNSNHTVSKSKEYDVFDQAYLLKARMPQSEQKLKRNQPYTKFKNHIGTTENKRYEHTMLNHMSTDIKSGGKDLGLLDTQNKDLKHNISVEKNLKIQFKKSSKTKRKFKKQKNLDLEELNLPEKYEDYQKSPYRVHSLKNSYDLTTVRPRNNSQESKPKILIESLDSKINSRDVKLPLEKSKPSLNESLPSINQGNKLYPYTIKSKPSSRFCKIGEKNSDSGESPSAIGMTNLAHLKSSNIYNAGISRNNAKLLESSESVLRARSYNKCAKSKFLVIQDDFTEIDQYLLGKRNQLRGKEEVNISIEPQNYYEKMAAAYKQYLKK